MNQIEMASVNKADRGKEREMVVHELPREKRVAPRRSDDPQYCDRHYESCANITAVREKQKDRDGELARVWDEIEASKKAYVPRWVFLALMAFWILSSVALYERLGQLTTKVEVIGYRIAGISK